MNTLKAVTFGIIIILSASAWIHFNLNQPQMSFRQVIKQGPLKEHSNPTVSKKSSAENSTNTVTDALLQSPNVNDLEKKYQSLSSQDLLSALKEYTQKIEAEALIDKSNHGQINPDESRRLVLAVRSKIAINKIILDRKLKNE